MVDEQPGLTPSLIQRSILPARVAIISTSLTSGPGDLAWYVESVYRDGSSRRSGPYTRQVATLCRDTLAQAFALEWEQEGG